MRKIKSFSVILIPDDPSFEAKSRKLTMTKILLLLSLYTILAAIVGYYAISLTGLESVLPGKFGLHETDLEEMEKLNEKIIFLARELQNLELTNERLKYALILSDSTFTDSLNFGKDSVVGNNKLPIEGNIFEIISRLINYSLLQDEPVFFLRPLNGFISNKFNLQKGHPGIDIVAKEETPVFASAGGYVIFADYTTDFGNMIILNHAFGYITVYKHCSSLLKQQREKIEQGEMIALSGNSGTHSTGPHLHFEIWKDGQAIDPELVLINN